MKIKVVTLTPSKAEKLLNNRAANRPLDEQYAHRLSEAMKAGRWKLNGETIKINNRGQLEDGQHRCLAVWKSGCSIEVAIASDITSDDGVFESIDIGKRRTIGHMFARAGEQNYSMLASAAAWLWRYREAQLSCNFTPRHDQARAILDEHPRLRDSCSAVHSCRKVLPSGMAAAFHYIFSETDPVMATWFFDALGSGEDLSKHSPKTSAIFRLRELVLADRSKRIKRHQYMLAALLIKAWNATRAGAICRSLRWAIGEEFPKVE